MKNLSIELRISRLEKQANIYRYATYGLLAFSILLVGQVTAQNEVINVDRVVASEFVLSKDGKEYGKWNVEPERELTSEKREIYEKFGMTSPDTSPAYPQFTMWGDDDSNAISPHGINITRKDSSGNYEATIDASTGFISTDGEEMVMLGWLTGLSLMNSETPDYINLQRDSGLDINITSK